MKEKIKGFWKEHKETIKTGMLLVSIPVAILGIVAINCTDKIVKENNLQEYFY